MEFKLWNILRELQSEEYTWIDLSHSMNNNSPYWSGIPEGAIDLGKPVFDWGNPMLECQIQTFKFPGQFGTHIDFPGHFIKGSKLSEQFSPKHMLFPLCVIDISKKANLDVHYAVTVNDIKEYEKDYGIIPEGAFVALRTDWSKKWPNMEQLCGIDEDGSENFPGWSLEALQYIYEVRNAAANGHETFDTDASIIASNNGDLICERYVLAQEKLQIELLNNLDKVAPAGDILFAAWPNIEGATGLPVRAFAITKK